MTQEQHYLSFDPSWLAIPPPASPLVSDAPYIIVSSDTFQCLLCASDVLNVSLLHKHLKSAKHYKRYGLLMRAYRLERGDFEGDDCDANTMTTPINLPLTHDKTTTTRRRYPDSWLQQTPLPSKLDHQQVSYGERIYDHVSKTLRWRCLLCDSGWMGNGSKDAMEHCAGRKHGINYEQFKVAYLQHAREAAEREAANQAEAAREDAAKQAAERLAAERLQQQQQEILKRQHAPMEPAAKESLQNTQQRRDDVHGQPQQETQQEAQQEMQQFAIPQQQNLQMARTTNLKQQSTTCLSIVSPPPSVSVAPKFEPHWLQRPLKGVSAYNNVPYGQIKMIQSSSLSSMAAKWRCLLCSSGWMPADEPFPLRHCQGKTHATNYQRLEQAVAANELAQRTNDVKVAADASSDAKEPMATPLTAHDVAPHVKEHAAVALQGTNDTKVLAATSSDVMEPQLSAPAAHGVAPLAKELAAVSPISFAHKVPPQATEHSATESTAKTTAAPWQTIDPAWLKSPPPGQFAYDNVSYGEHRITSGGKREWRCMLCRSNWMTANGKDQQRHAQGNKHGKCYQRFERAYEALALDAVNAGGKLMARATAPATTLAGRHSATNTTTALSFLDAARGNSQKDANEQARDKVKVPASPTLPSAAPSHPPKSKPLAIDDKWLACPPPGQNAYENVLYGELREQHGKPQWRCLLCDSNWMAANDKDRPRHTSGSKHAKQYARLVAAYEKFKSSGTEQMATCIIDNATNTIATSWLAEPPKGQLAYENVPYGALCRNDNGKELWRCLLCDSAWIVATDETRLKHCRGHEHAVRYRQLVEAFEEGHHDDSQSGASESGQSESRDIIPTTFEYAEQPLHRLEKRWGDFTSEVFTTADETWLPIMTIDDLGHGKSFAKA